MRMSSLNLIFLLIDPKKESLFVNKLKYHTLSESGRKVEDVLLLFSFDLKSKLTSMYGSGTKDDSVKA